MNRAILVGLLGTLFVSVGVTLSYESTNWWLALAALGGALAGVGFGMAERAGMRRGSLRSEEWIRDRVLEAHVRGLQEGRRERPMTCGLPAKDHCAHSYMDDPGQ